MPDSDGNRGKGDPGEQCLTGASAAVRALFELAGKDSERGEAN